MTFINVYIPPGSNWTIYKQIFDLMVNSQGLVICGGDFNIRLNPKLDVSGASISSNALTKKCNQLMEELGIIDVWRELHPKNRDYTHYSCPHRTYSRIDYFFMFSNDCTRVKGCQIKTIDLSDHSPISLSLSLEKKARKVLWKLNSTILNDPILKQKLREEIKDFLELNDTGEVSQIILWDTLKAVMRGKIISMTSHLKKIKLQKLVNLQAKLKQLQREDGYKGNSETKNK